MAGSSGVAEFGDTTVRIWRPTSSQDAMGVEVRTLAPIGTAIAVVNRPTAPTGQVAGGLAPIGTERLYFDPDVDVRERDVLEFVAGPDVGRRLEVDEPPTRPQGEHLQVDTILWHGTLPGE